MDTDDTPRKALYLGSFPVTLSNPPDRARFIAQQLDHINRGEQSHPSYNGTPVNIRMMLCGIKVTAQTTQDTYMVHALRRVSFSTCLDELFAFAARDPGQPLDKQFCHVFKTKSSDVLNSIIGGAFQSAYTLNRKSNEEEGSIISGRESRQSNISTMSTTSAMYQNTTRPLATSTGPLMAKDLNQKTLDSCDETFAEFQHDYDPDYSVPNTEPTRTTDYQSHSTTVRSKLSAHSDDSAISSLADDLERRVILEIERKADKKRENDLAMPNRCSSRRRSFKRDHGAIPRDPILRDQAPRSGRSLSASTQSDRGRQSIRCPDLSHSRNDSSGMSHSRNDSSGYSSINMTDSLASSTLLEPPKLSKLQNFANMVKTNPVARKLKILAPGDSYSDLDSRLRIAKWYHQGLPKDVAISVLSQAETGTFLVLPQTLLLRGYDHVHEYQIIKESKIGWYLKGSSRAFPHLLMLVAHYQSHKDILPLLLENAPLPK